MTFFPGSESQLYAGQITSVRMVNTGSGTAVAWNPNTTTVMFSTRNPDGTWTEPVVGYTNASGAVLLGFVYTGSAYTIAVRIGSTPTLLNSTNLTTWGTSRTGYTGMTSMVYTGGYYYATAITGANATVARSATGSGWTLYETISYLNAVTNRDPVIFGNIYVAVHEGTSETLSLSDRVLVSKVDSKVTEPILTGAKAIAGTSGAMIYHDISTVTNSLNWGWMRLDGGRWLRQGTFAQSGTPGPGDISAITGGFAVAYVRGEVLYYRELVEHVDEIRTSAFPAPVVDHVDDRLENFIVEMSLGNTWIDVSDHVNYRISPTDFGDSAQTLRRITASSNHYDGTVLIHTTKEQVQETITVTVYGQDQNQVTENLLLLQEIVEQPLYRVRMTYGNHRQTWLCDSADFNISRGHVFMHNTMAQMRLSIPRFPRVTYEAL